MVRNAGAERELTMMRWGMPPLPKFGGPPVTNIRNTSSPHWRGWRKPENRCLVPANSFSEYAPEPNPVTKKKDVVWSLSMRAGRSSPSPESGPSSEVTAVRPTSRTPAAQDLAQGVLSSLSKHDGKGVQKTNEGKPAKWRLADRATAT